VLQVLSVVGLLVILRVFFTSTVLAVPDMLIYSNNDMLLICFHVGIIVLGAPSEELLMLWMLSIKNVPLRNLPIVSGQLSVDDDFCI